MSSFTDPLIIEDIGNRIFRLFSEFRYHVGDEASNEVITVPKGFLTDFASVPKIFWNILPPHGPYGKAAVIHDAGYQTGGFGGKYTRKRIDEIFLEGMEVLKVGWFVRRTMFRAVRLFAGRAWGHLRVERAIVIAEKAQIPISAAVTAPKPIQTGVPSTEPEPPPEPPPSIL